MRLSGSGASGGWVAKELDRAWHDGADARSGPATHAHAGLHRAHLAVPSEVPRVRKSEALLTNQPVQRLCYACDEYSHQFFVNDHENPYTTPPDKPFMWIRGRQVGGKTFCWARESYRYSDYEFKAASRDGYGEDWPFRYQDLEPYYDKVESLHRGERIARRPGINARRQIPAAHASFLRREMAREVIGKKFGWW